MKKDLDNQIAEVDALRLESYLRLYDRIVLYNLIAQLMSDENIKESINKWELIVKRSIDEDAQARTDFLESTSTGRLAKMHHVKDGESIRLEALQICNIAKMVIQQGLLELKPGDDWKTED